MALAHGYALLYLSVYLSVYLCTHTHMPTLIQAFLHAGLTTESKEMEV